MNKFRMIKGMLLTVMLLTGCGASGNTAANQTGNELTPAGGSGKMTVISPIIDNEGADPFVIRYQDGYLYTKTTGGNICLGYSSSLMSLGGTELTEIYHPEGELQDFWAPEIWHFEDGWYIYFAALVPGEEMHFMYVLHNPAEDPLSGEWTLSKLDGMDDKFAIDGTVLELDDRKYFIWSGWPGYQNLEQDIYIAEMETPTRVKDEKILLSSPEYDWETVEDPKINEAPEIVRNNDTVNLVYSASGSWTDSYCLGVLTMNAADDPTEPSSWTKKDQPVMAAAGDVYGPGHCSFTSSKDDQESIVVYHAARWSGGGWNRSVRFGYTDFDENGAIQAMTPVSGEDTLKIPGGEKEVLYLDLKDTQTEGDLKLIADNEDDPGKDAVGFVSREDVVTFTISSHAEQDANITAYVRCEDLYEGVVTSMELQSLSKENSLPSPSSRNVFGAENAQPLTWRVHLTKGDNTFRLHSDMGGTKLTLTNIAVQPVN